MAAVDLKEILEWDAKLQAQGGLFQQSRWQGTVAKLAAVAHEPAALEAITAHAMAHDIIVTQEGVALGETEIEIEG